MPNLAYLYGQPTVYGEYKQQLSDFVVKEDLGFTPEGDGEHVMLYVRKTDCNTIYVAEQLARFAGISPRQVTYAGLKDRYAITEQWFGLHLPGQATPDFSQFSLPGCEILQVTRQRKKLRIGVLRGNYFELLLRQVSDQIELETRLQQIAQHGVPNYYGEQRFGRDNLNLTKALAWAANEIKVKDRQKRSFYLSAARSAVFNAVVSARIEQKLASTVLAGDVLQLANSNSWFIADESELPALQARLSAGELRLTAPMIGEDALPTQQAALQFETQVLENWQMFRPLWQQARMQGSRRSILVKPQQLHWQWQDRQTVKLHFWLDSGSYATSVLRELCQKIEQPIINQHNGSDNV